jgi:hypothetical protein
MNRQNSKRPTLAELWRTLLTFLEDQGVEDAPARARSLAISAWMGWDSGLEARRVRQPHRRPCRVR